MPVAVPVVVPAAAAPVTGVEVAVTVGPEGAGVSDAPAAADGSTDRRLAVEAGTPTAPGVVCEWREDVSFAEIYVSQIEDLSLHSIPG